MVEGLQRPFRLQDLLIRCAIRGGNTKHIWESALKEESAIMMPQNGMIRSNGSPRREKGQAIEFIDILLPFLVKQRLRVGIDALHTLQKGKHSHMRSTGEMPAQRQYCLLV